MLSGGIGHYYFHPIPIFTVSDVTLHDDLGPLLAESLRKHPAIQAYEIVEPAETLRATVLGASSQTVTLSGSTIWAEEQILPLRNVPVVRTNWEDSGGKPSFQPEVLERLLSAAVRRWDINPQVDHFAVAIDLAGQLDYNTLTQLANGLMAFSNRVLPGDRPLIVIIERDYAQALGQTLKAMAPTRPLLVIDQVGLEEGDYIDIGTPMMDGRVVPVSVKTLIFYH